MFPKVFIGYADAQRRYGPVAVLPTLVYFYGMEADQEIDVEIERGKSLVVRLMTIGEVEDDGRVRVFFELNGQPRIIMVADRKANASQTARRMADPADETQLGAPMPGVVATLSVRQGDRVKAGDPLMTLEAMKMETAVTAPRDGLVIDLAVHIGVAVEAKQLLMAIVP